ncbi:MAG: J domain-containing protein [Desulfobacteraceae bacterium]|nr:J domain-containing protein [Desulfobacteraceae bacterium]MBC2749343.1 J domain-containing protein [Desulfobacteraceae bacterium]
MPRDYYIVLGIEQGASLSDIKKAYRNAIKRYHPDKIGKSADPHKFRAAREAYEVLSDADKRRAYDAERQPQENPARGEDIPKATAHRYRTMPAFRSPPVRAPFPESMMSGSHRYRRQRPARGHDLYLDVILTEEEALHGGIFPLTIPVAVPCPHCFNRWGQPDVTCPACWGDGVVRSRRSFDLNLPPDLTDGTLLTVSFNRGGLGEITLLIAVRVR